jgi:ubiquinol-cytochrome c reductase iron-sulfur subunit
LKEEIDLDRRRFLTISTVIVGGVGATLATTPFIESWTPSLKAQALGAPVEFDITTIPIGGMSTVAWRGRPVLVVNRTKAMLDSLQNPALINRLRDPDSLYSEQPSDTKNFYRAIQENILVVTGLCTHLGCVPIYKPEPGSLEADWLGGFFCPCHGSKYDLAGRVYKGVPAPLNLPIPDYFFLKTNSNILRIGENQVEAKSN